MRFLGAHGLTYLLGGRELAQRTTGTQLHLAGLVAYLVARSLHVTELLERFDTYPTSDPRPGHAGRLSAQATMITLGIAIPRVWIILSRQLTTPTHRGDRFEY